MERITSKENQRIKSISQLLTDKNERDRTGCFVAEGVKLCLDALLSGIIIREVFVTPQTIVKYPELTRLIENAGAVFEIDGAAVARLSDTKSPQGVFALCEKRGCQRPENHAPSAKYLLLASLQDPGNVGSIIRTAEAFGLDGIALSADCPDVYGPKTLRSSMGGVFRINIWIAGDMFSEIMKLKSEGVTVYSTTLSPDSQKLGDLRFEGVCAAVLGNEGMGLDDALAAACQASLTIPMSGRADSLGVAVAAGILAWEMTKCVYENHDGYN